MQKNKVFGVIGVIIVVIGIIALSMWGLPKYLIYKQDLRGQAELREAEWTKRVNVEVARALKDSAVLEADAEVARAVGVAEANRIIADGLGGSQGYLRYLYINQLAHTANQIIYIPTEAGLPILEATRR